MDTKEIIFKLRTQHGLSQDELAEKVFVTRQAVSRWENGETTPNPETLKLLSKLFDVSINTLLGAPRQLICQCCGMPLEDSDISREKDGAFNEEYCKWCYADGEYAYTDLDELIDFCAKQMASEQFPLEQARSFAQESLPKLNYWKNRANIRSETQLEALKQQLIVEFNALRIPGMPRVESLNALIGHFVNPEYPLPSGKAIPFLNDNATYLGAQLQSEQDASRCFGLIANADFLLVCTYGENGTDPELLLYKKR